MSKAELPAPVLEDLFDIECNNPEMAVGHITEQVEPYGFTVGDVITKGVMISVPFSHESGMNGVVTINRLERLFSVEGRDANGLFLPVTGEWRDVRTYLANLQRVVNTGPA